MSDLATTDAALVAHVDRDAILKHLNLDPSSTATQALLLICERYGLDPLLKHMVLIQGRPYVTRDGYLAVAHRSGQLDGIEILEDGEDDHHWWAKVAVHRRDMSKPFTYVGRYPHKGSNKDYGPEMAVKCAEVAALRRAFNVTGIGAADERWDEHMEPAQPVEMDPRLKAVYERHMALPEDKRQKLTDWIGDKVFNGEPGWEYADILVGWCDRLEPMLDRAEDAGADTHEPKRPEVVTADPTLLPDDDSGRPM